MGNKCETYPAPYPYVRRRTFSDETPKIAIGRLEPRKRPHKHHDYTLFPQFPSMAKRAALHKQIRAIKRARNRGEISPQKCDQMEGHILDILETLEGIK